MDTDLCTVDTVQAYMQPILRRVCKNREKRLLASLHPTVRVELASHHIDFS